MTHLTWFFITTLFLFTASSSMAYSIDGQGLPDDFDGWSDYPKKTPKAQHKNFQDYDWYNIRPQSTDEERQAMWRRDVQDKDLNIKQVQQKNFLDYDWWGDQL